MPPTPKPHARVSLHPPPRRSLRARRASAAVAMILVLLTLQLIIVGAIASGGAGASQTHARLDALRAFYAAEAGMNMALRELLINADEDGDGRIGGISDDGNDANDPLLNGAARFRVLRAPGEPLTLTSQARCGDARRSIRVTFE